MYDATILVSNPSFYFRITEGIRADLHVWLAFLKECNDITFIPEPSILTSSTLHMYSDSCKLGFGATFGTEYMYDAFPLVWQNYDIQVLELFPIFLLVQVFASTLANKFVVFHCDNLPIFSILNTQTSKNSKVMKLLRPMILSLLQYNVKFRATHIPGCSNILCDRLSRFKITDKLLRDYGMNLHPRRFRPVYTLCTSLCSKLFRLQVLSAFNYQDLYKALEEI